MRVSDKPYKLTQQLRFAATAAAAVPGWAGPTPAELEALAVEIETADGEIREKLSEIKGHRYKMGRDIDSARELMRRVDYITTGLFGKGAGEKATFGLKPEDTVRNRAPIPDVPSDLTLSDASAGFFVKWKGTRRASYEVQWFLDSNLQTLAGSLVSTSQKATITGLAQGTEIFVRVRASRSGRFTEWSETVRRFVNG